MKQIYLILLVTMICISGCTQSNSNKEQSIENNQTDSEIDDSSRFTSFNNPELYQYLQDNVYSNLVSEFDSEDYIVNNISATYVSEEYLEESACNSKSNIYFGYSLEEVMNQFDEEFVFTLDSSGNTIVEDFVSYDDTYDKVIKNITDGAGVILIFATVSVVSAHLPLPTAFNIIFSTAAKDAAKSALSSSMISAITASIVTGMETGDFQEVKKSSLLVGSEVFKWSAITGAISGVINESLHLYKSATTIPTPRQSELDVLNRNKGAVEQKTYLNGKEVAYNTVGSTRPDVIVNNGDGTIKAIEVKNYDLTTKENRNNLLHQLRMQISNRKKNLPKGSSQEIILDVRGRKYSSSLLDETVNELKDGLNSIVEDIPINLMTY